MIKRIDVIIRLKNMFDFEEFVKSCFELNKTPMTLTEFCNKIGMLKVAMVKYPKEEPLEAYLKIIDELNKSAGEPTRQNPHEHKKPCGTCGGKNKGGGRLI